MSFDYFSKRRMQYILEKLKTIFDTKANASDVPQNLSDLSDVEISSPSNNQIPMYNGTSHKWENQNLPSGTDLFTITLTSSEDPETGETIYTANKLPSEVIAAYNNGDVVQLVMSSGNLPYYFTLGNAVISEDESESETGFMFQRLFVYDNDEAAFGEFILVKQQNVDAWDYIEFIHNFLAVGGNSLVAEITENNNVYTCDKTFEEVNDAYYGSKDIFIKFGSRIFKIARYESSTNTFYFTSTIANANSIDVKTFVMTGSYITENWTSITLTESSGDPSAIRWEEARTSVKKNLLPSEIVSQTQNGLTFTVNADKSITVSGTASAITVIVVGYIDVKAGVQYKLTGGVVSDHTHLDLRKNNVTWTANTSGKAVISPKPSYGIDTFVPNSDDTLACCIRIANGENLTTPITFYPMIRLSSIVDDTYVPYIQDNVKLSDDISIILNSNSFKKNYISERYEEKSDWHGLTSVQNADGSVTITGTHNLQSGTTGFRSYGNKLEAGTYIYSLGTNALGSCLIIANQNPKELGASGTYKIIGTIDKDTQYKQYTYSAEDKATYPYIIYEIGIYYTVTNVNSTFYPMNRLASITDNTYVPYIPDNTELVDWKSNGVLGAKNFINNTLVTQTKNGVTFTVNSDKSITVSGTASAESDASVEISRFIIQPGTYRLSALPSNVDGGGSKIRCWVSANGSWIDWTDDGANSVESKLVHTFTTPTDVRVNAVVYKGKSYSTTFKPMIRLIADSDSTYQPYAKTNQILTEDVLQKVDWTGASTSVKKNLIPNNAVSKTINGVTFTVNSDGSVLVNGTNTASDWATTFEISTTLLKTGEYYLSQSYVSEGAIIFLRLRANNSMGTSIKELGNKSQDTFSLSNDTNVYCDIQIRPNGVVNNVVIKPMIRLASIENDTYVPYIPDNTELMRYTDNNILGAKNLLNHMGTDVTKNGLTITVDSNGIVNVNGTVTSGGSFAYNVITDAKLSLPAGNYILSFEDAIRTEAGGGTVNLRVRKNGASSKTALGSANYNNDTSFKFSVSSGDLLEDIYVNLNEGNTFNNHKFKFMIRLASDSDATYQPYAMTNRQLTELASVWTSSVSALAGATSVTITNANIHTSSTIEPFADNGTNTAMSMPTMTVTEGQCVLGFDALTANTSFKLRISN